MSPIFVVAIVIALLAIGFALFTYIQKNRSRHLRSRFGAEYDRVVDRYGDQHKAEEDLSYRERRVEKLHIRELDGRETNRFTEAWLQEQARFVDNPYQAVANADRLVGDLMKTRGYPVGDFEQRAADISVDHPVVVENYRAAHHIAGRSERGEANTEDLRQAIVYYRTLFEDLLKRHVHHSEGVQK